MMASWYSRLGVVWFPDTMDSVRRQRFSSMKPIGPSRREGERWESDREGARVESAGQRRDAVETRRMIVDNADQENGPMVGTARHTANTLVQQAWIDGRSSSPFRGRCSTKSLHSDMEPRMAVPHQWRARPVVKPEPG